MRRKYWMAFYDVKKAAFYYQIYGVSSSRWGKAVSVICTALSAGFVASCFFSETFPTLWAFLTLACQLVLAYQPFSSFSERKTAAQYIVQDINKLALEAERDWEVVRQTDDEERISHCIDELRTKQDAIEERFATVATFPMNDIIHRRAIKKTNNYFRRFEHEHKR